jgi:hypothetical protein
MTHGTKGMTQCGNDVCAAIGDIPMRRAITALVLLIATVAGCGYPEKQRQTEEYERFLEKALGTIAAD